MTDTSRSISVAVLGGGMFFDDIIGQSFKDLIRGGIAGSLTSIGMSHLASAVAEVMFRNVETVSAADDAGSLTSLFAKGYVAIVIDEKQRPLGIITKMDLVDHLARRGEQALSDATK